MDLIHKFIQEILNKLNSDGKKHKGKEFNNKKERHSRQSAYNNRKGKLRLKKFEPYS